MNRIHNSINIVNSNNSQNVLKDGSSVFVRILNTTDTPNKYIASFAGTMFEVSSKETLLPGNTFKATIKMQGKTLHLIPTTISESKEIENQINKLDVKSFTQNNQQIIELLKNLNLPQDKISLNLIQFFQQHQLKLNIPQIKKSRSKAKNILSTKNKNPNTPKTEDELSNLSQLDLNFATKGFSLSEEKLEKLAKYLHLIEDENSQYEKNEEQGNQETKNNLTLINQIKNKDSKYHWILLPFEINLTKTKFTGNIRFLIDLDEKKLQKTYIFCTNGNKNYYFMIYYKCDDLQKYKNIKYFCEPEIEKTDILILKNLFSDDKEFLDIEFSSEAKTQGLFTEDLPITIVEYNA